MKLFEDLAKTFDGVAKAVDENIKKAACVITSVVQLGAGIGGGIFGQQTPPPPPAGNEKKIISSVEMAGAPIATQHMDSTDRNYNQHHFFFSTTLFTNGYGNWGAFTLLPNSMRQNTLGVFYSLKPIKTEFGNFSLGFSLVGGAITGYEYPVLPFIGGQAQLTYKLDDKTTLGIASMIMPYPVIDDGFKGFGAVVTTPVPIVTHRF